MKASRSPEPWSIYQAGQKKFNIIADGNGSALARVFIYPASASDANLMAAAPAVLAALKKLDMRWGDYLHFAARAGEAKDGDYLRQAREYQAEARAAIAAAEGN